MRLINIDDIMRLFPNADIDADALDNLQAYPYWKTDITGLINILKQTPKVEMAEDCISREAVIEDVIKCTDMNEDTMEVLEDKVRALQPVTPKTEWIPVSEGLPEEKIEPITEDFYEYQCTVKFGDFYDVRSYKFGNGHWWFDGGLMDGYVTAWLPIPEPYKAESKDKK